MKRFICLCILFVFLLFMYAKYIEPYSFTSYEYNIQNEKIPKSFDGIKIVHFSDLLYTNKSDNSFLKDISKEITELNSDILVFTGDLTRSKLKEEKQKELITALKSIKPKLYKYAILGDRDSKVTKSILEESGFIILENSSKFIFNESSEPILIAGGNDLTKELTSPQEDISYSYKIALIHKPDDFDTIKNEYDLVLAGHSLGGQIRLPYVGATIKKDGATKYTDKTYHEQDNYLYISFGIGTDKPYLRLFNKPSINIYRLQAK